AAAVPASVPRSIGSRPPADSGTEVGSLTATSPPSEAGGPLLGERGQALAEVLAARRQLEGEGLVVELLVEGGLRARLEQPLGEPESLGGAGGEALDQPRDLVVEPLGRDGPVHEPPLGGLGAGERAPQQQQLAGPHGADQAGQQPG